MNDPPFGRVREREARYEHSIVFEAVLWPLVVAHFKIFPGQATGSSRLAGAVYVVGGALLIVGLMNAGLIDELRLIVHPELSASTDPYSDELIVTIPLAAPAVPLR
jgi:hypothetical protein